VSAAGALPFSGFAAQQALELAALLCVLGLGALAVGRRRRC